jgi:hypothetical protein
LIILYEIPDALRKKQERFWVLDGQQRLLSLTLIMKGKVEAIKDGEKKTVKLDIWFKSFCGKVLRGHLAIMAISIFKGLPDT